MGRRALALAVLSLFASGAGSAVNPLDDDAGSGMDAGDIREAALAIQPGGYEGRVARPYDLWDYYVFEATAGQVVRLSLVGTAGVYGSIESFDGVALASVAPGESAAALIPANGPTLLAITTAFIIAAPEFGTLDYGFLFSLETPAHSALWTANGPASVAEYDWGQPVQVNAHASVALPLEVQSAMQVMLALEAWIEPEGYVWEIHVFQFATQPEAFGSGLGHTILIAPGMSSGIALPEMGINESGGWVALSVDHRAVRWLRVVMSGTPGQHLLTSFSEAPFRRDFSGEVESFLWDESNSGAEVQVLAPGLSVTGPRQLARDLTARHIVFFDPGGWMGAITDPSGQSTPTTDPKLIIFPASTGEWRFDLGPTIGAGLGAVHRYLHEVRVPYLDVIERGMLTRA